MPETSQSTAESTMETLLRNLQDGLSRQRSSADSLPPPKDIQFQRTIDRSFARTLDSTSANVLSLINSLVQISSESLPESSYFTPLDNLDDVLYNYSSVVHVVDGLIERSDKSLKSISTQQQETQEQTTSTTAKAATNSPLPQQALPKHLRTPRNILKPQDQFRTPANNARGVVWRPLLEPESNGIRQKYNKIVPLSLEITSMLDQHDVKFESVPHPYTVETQQLILDSDLPAVYNEPPLSSGTPPTFQEKPLLFVNTVQQFNDMLSKLQEPSCKQIAVDVEHHNHRTYNGIVCLLQISSREQDWVIDVLVPEVRDVVVKLNTVFTHPDVVKIFHGAASDIIWLQRDFGVYIVNLFDTYDVTKLLEFPSHSLAGLLEKYCSYTADKRYQMADWRIRPLPVEMLEYARSDTHYLHYIFDRLIEELKKKAESENMPSETLIKQVIDRSAKTSLKIYVHEDYDYESGTGPRGWRGMIRRWVRRQIPRGKHYHQQQPQQTQTQQQTEVTEDPLSLPTELTEEEYPSSNKWNVDLRLGARGPGRGKDFEIVRTLHDWRDRIARDEDESLHFIMNDPTLMVLAEDYESWKLSEQQLRNKQSRNYRPSNKVNLSKAIEKRWVDIAADVEIAIKRAEVQEEEAHHKQFSNEDPLVMESETQTQEAIITGVQDHHPSSPLATTSIEQNDTKENHAKGHSLFQLSQPSSTYFAGPPRVSSSLFGETLINDIVSSTSHSSLFFEDENNTSQPISILSQINASFAKFPVSQQSNVALMVKNEKEEVVESQQQVHNYRPPQISVVDDDGESFMDIDQDQPLSTTTTAPDIKTTSVNPSSTSEQVNDDIVQVRDIYPTKMKIKSQQSKLAQSLSTKKPHFGAEKSPLLGLLGGMLLSTHNDATESGAPDATQQPSGSGILEGGGKTKKSKKRKKEEKDENEEKRSKMEKKERKKKKKEERAAAASHQGDDGAEKISSGGTGMMIVEPFDYSSSSKLLDASFVKKNTPKEKKVDNEQHQQKHEKQEKQEEKEKQERKLEKERKKEQKEQKAAKKAAKEERKKAKKLAHDQRKAEKREAKKQKKNLEKESLNIISPDAASVPSAVGAESTQQQDVNQNFSSSSLQPPPATTSQFPISTHSPSSSLLAVDSNNGAQVQTITQVNEDQSTVVEKDRKDRKEKKEKKDKKDKKEKKDKGEMKDETAEKDLAVTASTVVEIDGESSKKKQKKEKVKQSESSATVEGEGKKKRRKRKRGGKGEDEDEGKDKQKRSKSGNSGNSKDNKYDPSKLIVKPGRGGGNKSATFVD